MPRRLSRRRTRKRKYSRRRKLRGGGTIPKIFMQTAKDPIEPYVVEMNRKKTKGWEYIFFDDDGILRFFDENPLKEFPNIKSVFQSFYRGAA